MAREAVRSVADIQELIKTIMAHPKVAASGNLAAKVYRDEPILLTASQVERQAPPQYRAMRKLAQSGNLRHESEARIFWEQGRFMADFEDDFDYQGDFARYFPTYQAMNDQQLRGYFSWRTRARHGRLGKTPLSFVFVYIYELLNQIGVSSPEAGFHTLKNFWLAYREIDPQIDRYVRTWLRDYVVYHNLDQSLLDDPAEANFDRGVLTLLNYRSSGPEEVFAALNSLSSYNLENSRFFKQHPDEVKKIVGEVFASYSEHYEQSRKGALGEKFFGKVYAGSYIMFGSAVFYDPAPPRDFSYEINSVYKYTCKRGNWSCERFFCYGGQKQPIGALLKTIDFLMRQKYNFKSTLKPGKVTKKLEGLISRAIEKHQKGQGESARPKIEIDVSKLRNIREAALATQSKLIIEEPAEAGAPEISPENFPEKFPEKSGPGPDLGLSDVEHQFLSRLLSGRDYEEPARTRGLMLSVLIEAVNEKLINHFGDTVIAEVDGRPEVFEDYMDELKELFA